MVKTTHLAYRVNSQTLTEYILIRETLWFDIPITFDWLILFLFILQAINESITITYLCH